MHDDIVHAEQNSTLYFFAERRDRLFQQQLIGGREINQIIRMNQDRRKLCATPGLLKQIDRFDRQWLGHPAARVTRKELHCIAASFFGDDQRLMQTTFYRRVETYLRSFVFCLWRWH